MGEFIGRTQELALLNRLYDKGSDMVLLTGRRRVGKTRLLKEFMKGKDSLYFLATNATEADMLRNSGTVSDRRRVWEIRQDGRMHSDPPSMEREGCSSSTSSHTWRR
jgi:predicted AAA+ superfamily ATPase